MKVTDTYNGGKSGSGTYQQIINHIPPHSIYIEPFAGHGGILRKIRRAKISVLNDKDTAIYKKWFDYKEENLLTSRTPFKQSSFFDEQLLDNLLIVLNSDYQNILQQYRHNPQAFIYCDPPYLMSTRRSQQRLYKYEWEGEQEHIELAGMLHTCKCAVMISHYPCSLYDNLYKGWHTHTFTNTTRQGPATECIYFNYDPPEILHDTQYIGRNYRDREDIKRMIARWNKKLSELPTRKRIALLSSIVNNYKQQTEKLIQL